MPESKRTRPRLLQRVVENINKGAQNALELARFGRLSEARYAPFTVARRERVYRLRHYAMPAGVQATGDPILLVPPLMITSEIYDISPDSSAVTSLVQAGVDTFVVDFGNPEEQEGGLDRTLDDHVRCVSGAVDHVRRLTGKDVHLAGYSQGGMFCYQAAAYRHSEGLSSLITFGSPVDLYRNLPGEINADLVERLVDSTSGLADYLLDTIESVPAALSSSGFRIISARKELSQFLDFLGNLHDREALQKGESSRRYLHGEGFVAWPGPALRAFFEQFVRHNRLSSGGFVIDGQTLSLADITVPILYFVGENDEFARPPSVRAIREASPHSQVYEVSQRTGHFGLVVGSKSMENTWPTVQQWLRWHDKTGPKPSMLSQETQSAFREVPLEDVIEANFEDVGYNVRLMYDTARSTADGVRRRLGGMSRTLSAMFDNMRWQVPRLAELDRVQADTRINVGLSLDKQAASIGDATFFLWQGRAHSYADANQRVNHVVRGLIQCGVRPGQRVGVLMDGRPTYLSLVAALSRLGAVAVLLEPDGRRVALDRALEMGKVQVLITDPERCERGRSLFDGPVLVLGGGGGTRTLIDGVVDMEAIDPTGVQVPDWYRPNPGRAADLAMIIFTAGRGESPRAARITNRRWAVAAYGAAAASTLTSKDTVLCCMPLHHAAGLLVSVGGALVGGARLALSEGEFSPDTFWRDARRYGVTVVYYAGEMCRKLVDAPSTVADAMHPIKLFAGSGMRQDVWLRMKQRFGNVGILEFYATTEGTAVLANVSGQKVGSLGRPLPGSSDMAVVAYDFEAERFVTDENDQLVRCFSDQPGVLIARVDATHPMSAFDGYVDARATAGKLITGAFEQGDTWFVTGDVMRRDPDGSFWFVDRASDMVRTAGGPISTVQVEDALYSMPEVQHAVVYGVPLPDSNVEMPVATVVVRQGYTLDAPTLVRMVERRLDPTARPRFIRIREEVGMSVGFRPLKRPLQAEGVPAEATDTLRYDERLHLYEPMTSGGHAETLQQIPRERTHATETRTGEEASNDLPETGFDRKADDSAAGAPARREEPGDGDPSGGDVEVVTTAEPAQASPVTDAHGPEGQISHDRSPASASQSNPQIHDGKVPNAAATPAPAGHAPAENEVRPGTGGNTDERRTKPTAKTKTKTKAKTKTKTKTKTSGTGSPKTGAHTTGKKARRKVSSASTGAAKKPASAGSRPRTQRPSSGND